MAITDIQRNYLNYRPKYGYEPPYLARITKISGSLEQYIPSKCVLNALNILPSSILEQIDTLLGDITSKLRQLEACLQHNKANDISFPTYKTELETNKPNYAIINQYEGYHKSSLDGKIQVEVYKALHNLSSEFTAYKDTLSHALYSSNPKASIEAKQGIDKAYLDTLMEKDINQQLTNQDILDSNTKAQVNYHCLTKVIQAQEYVSTLSDICSTTVSDRYNGHILPTMEQYANTSISNLKSMNVINIVQYNRSVAASANAVTQDNNLNSAEFKIGIEATLFTVSEARLTSRQDLLTWITNLNTDNDNGPLISLADNLVETIQVMDNEYNAILTATLSQDKSDSMYKQAITDALKDKKLRRQEINLLNDIITERESGVFDLDSFIKKHRLLEPGTMCTP